MKTKFDTGYIDLLAYLSGKGTWVRETRGTVSYEGCRPWSDVMVWPYLPVVTSRTRKINYYFMIAEWLWISLGMSKVAPLAVYNSRMNGFSDDGIFLAGSYGPRLLRDAQGVRQKLLKDPDSRQGIINLWQPDLLHRPSKDVPCTLTFHFMAAAQDPNKELRVNKRELDLIVNMRSNDAWLGLPYDMFTFAMLHRQMAESLGMEPGRYTHIANSEHIYQEHVEKAKDVVRVPDFMNERIFEEFLNTQVPALPVLMPDSGGMPLNGLQELFTRIPELDKDQIEDRAFELGWKEGIPWLLFLMSKHRKCVLTGSRFLDRLMNEMEDRKKEAVERATKP